MSSRGPVKFGFIPAALVADLSLQDNWQARLSAVDNLKNLVDDLSLDDEARRAVVPHLGPLVKFFCGLIKDPDLKICLTAIQTMDVAVTVFGALLGAHVSPLVPPLIERLASQKKVVLSGAAGDLLRHLMHDITPGPILTATIPLFVASAARVREAAVTVVALALLVHPPTDHDCETLAARIGPLLLDESKRVSTVALETLALLAGVMGNEHLTSTLQESVPMDSIASVRKRIANRNLPAPRLATDTLVEFANLEGPAPAPAPVDAAVPFGVPTNGAAQSSNRSSYAAQASNRRARQSPAELSPEMEASNMLSPTSNGNGVSRRRSAPPGSVPDYLAPNDAQPTPQPRQATGKTLVVPMARGTSSPTFGQSTVGPAPAARAESSSQLLPPKAGRRAQSATERLPWEEALGAVDRDVQTSKSQQQLVKPVESRGPKEGRSAPNGSGAASEDEFAAAKRRALRRIGRTTGDDELDLSGSQLSLSPLDTSPVSSTTSFSGMRSEDSRRSRAPKPLDDPWAAQPAANGKQNGGAPTLARPWKGQRSPPTADEELPMIEPKARTTTQGRLQYKKPMPAGKAHDEGSDEEMPRLDLLKTKVSQRRASLSYDTPKSLNSSHSTLAPPTPNSGLPPPTLSGRGREDKRLSKSLPVSPKLLQQGPMDVQDLWRELKREDEEFLAAEDGALGSRSAGATARTSGNNTPKLPSRRANGGGLEDQPLPRTQSMEVPGLTRSVSVSPTLSRREGSAADGLRRQPRVQTSPNRAGTRWLDEPSSPPSRRSASASMGNKSPTVRTPAVPARLTAEFMPREELTACADPSGSLRGALADFDSKEWDGQLAALTELRSVVVHNPEAVDNAVAVATAALTGANSLRSSVSRSGVALLGELAEVSGRGLDSIMEKIIPSLIKRTAESSVFMVEEAGIALMHVVTSCGPARVLPPLFGLVGSKNAQARASIAISLRNVVDTLGAKTHQLRDFPALLEHLSTLSGDANPQARDASRNALAALAASAPSATTFRAAVDSLGDSGSRRVNEAIQRAGQAPKTPGAAPRTPHSAPKTPGGSLGTTLGGGSGGGGGGEESARRSAPKSRPAARSASKSRSNPPELEPLPGIYARMSVTDAKERLDGLNGLLELLQSFPEQMARAVDVDFGDAFCPRLTDANTNVRLAALRGMETVAPALGPALGSFMESLLPGLVSSLSATLQSVQTAGLNALSVLASNVDPLSLVGPLSQQIGLAHAKAKPPLLDALGALIGDIASRKPSDLTKHVFPMIGKLLQSTRAPGVSGALEQVVAAIGTAGYGDQLRSHLSNLPPDAADQLRAMLG